MYPYRLVVSLALLLPFVTTSALAADPTPAQKRAEIRKMRAATLADLYKQKPEAKAKIAKAAGYAVFSNFGMQVIFFGGGGGRGVVVDNATKKETFMKMGEVSLGLGLGMKEFRAIFVFKDKSTLKRFVDSGWEFGADADAAAKAEGKGAAMSEAASVQAGIEIYQLTKTGAIASLNVAGTKYWKDDELNK